MTLFTMSIVISQWQRSYDPVLIRSTRLRMPVPRSLLWDDFWSTRWWTIRLWSVKCKNSNLSCMR